MSVVVITGCSSGFGMLSAVEFARRGDQVFATMRDSAKSGPLKAAAEAAKTSVEVLELDVNERESVETAIGEVINRAGRIDVLVNNAGIGTHGPVEDFEDDEVAAIFETNVFGLLRVTRAAVPHMRSQASGTVVNIGSLSGKVTVPFFGIYGASKHAVEALSDALYYELHPFGIRVVLIEPGNHATEISNNLRSARRFTEGSAYLGFKGRFAGAPGKPPSAGQSADPQLVANVIVDATKAGEPKRRYLVGRDAELMGGMVKQLSDEDLEKAMRTTLDFWD